MESNLFSESFSTIKRTYMCSRVDHQNKSSEVRVLLSTKDMLRLDNTIFFRNFPKILRKKN